MQARLEAKIAGFGCMFRIVGLPLTNRYAPIGI